MQAGLELSYIGWSRRRAICSLHKHTCKHKHRHKVTGQPYAPPAREAAVVPTLGSGHLRTPLFCYLRVFLTFVIYRFWWLNVFVQICPVLCPPVLLPRISRLHDNATWTLMELSNCFSTLFMAQKPTTSMWKEL